MLSLPFIKFWAEFTKDSQIIDFLDTFLLNVRKHNDVYKLQIAVEETVHNQEEKKGEKQESDEEEEYKGDVDMIRKQLNQVLGVVLKIFYRLSKPVESEEDQFPLHIYREIIYKNFIFDMAKLYDIIAIYGQSNTETVKSIVANVFENDKRYV